MSFVLNQGLPQQEYIYILRQYFKKLKKVLFLNTVLQIDA